MSEEKKEFPVDGSKIHGVEIGYTIEARLNYVFPKTIHGQIFDKEWRQVRNIRKSEDGVPDKDLFGILKIAGCFSYASAQALRWWFIAAVEKDSTAICLETRLVRHKIKFSIEDVAVEARGFVGEEKRFEP